jgi:hypothetical protein
MVAVFGLRQQLEVEEEEVLMELAAADIKAVVLEEELFC